MPYQGGGNLERRLSVEVEAIGVRSKLQQQCHVARVLAGHGGAEVVRGNTWGDVSAVLAEELGGGVLT